LRTLKGDYERHGPTSEVPFFVGRDPLSVVIEPMLASAGSLMYIQMRSVSRRYSRFWIAKTEIRGRTRR
jgi:hypothetical protein